MICGNKVAQGIITSYFEKIKQGNVPFRFLLLEGPENIGKTTLIKQLATQLLGQHMITDFLYLKDLSKYLGKKQTIKVSVDKKDQAIINIEGKGNFINRGSREIIEWLYKSPVGKMKILLLENIERMTIQAANAFLKTFEEPLDNRIIIATASNKSNVLETITSRAFITRFDIPDHNLTKEFLQKKYPEFDEKNLNLIISFAMGRIGFAIQLIETVNNNGITDYKDIIAKFDRFIHLSQQNGMFHEKLQILNETNKNGLLQLFFDALVYYFSKQGEFNWVNKILLAKKRINANVSVENALFEMIIN